MVSAPTVAKPWGAGGWRLCPGQFSASIVRNSRSRVDSSDRPPEGFPSLVAGCPGQTFQSVCFPVGGPNSPPMTPGCRSRPSGRYGRVFSKGSRSSSSPKAASFAAAGSPIRTPAPFVGNASCNCPGSRILSARFAAGPHPRGNCRFRTGSRVQAYRDRAQRAGGRGTFITRPVRGVPTPVT